MVKRLTIASLVFGFTFTLSAQSRQPLPDFDIRELQSANPRSTALIEARKASLAQFASLPEQIRTGTRIVPNGYGLPKLYLREAGTLSAASTLKPVEIARDFLRGEPQIFALSATDIDRLRVVTEDITDSAKFLAFNQTVNGIDVFNAQIKVTLNKSGAVVEITMNDVVPGLNISTSPRLTREEAIAAALAAVSPNTQPLSPPTAELSIFPMDAVSARLAYRVFAEIDDQSWYEILIDAENGAALFRHNLYVFAVQGRVWAESPMKDSRNLVTFSDAWLPSGGLVTTGNNVDAYLDANGDDRADTTTDPSMRDGRAYSATQTFDFPFGDGTLQQDPRLTPAAAVTNLFYFINIAHDYYYGLGFNETAGNFQTSNFDRGGVGNDAVVAEAQFGRLTNNAAFSPTPEGIAPKIRMGIFTRNTTSKTDDLDSSFDGQVVIHEYGHGVTNRLIGAKTSTTCLTKIQSSALGEGWSDYFGNSFFNNPVQGAYIGQNATRGLRRYSYDGYPLTYEDVGNEGYESHNDGEIWAATLWDLRKSLGAMIVDRLVMDGLKATPCNPSMTDARDGILSGDMANNNGANRKTIWTIFAKHGLGYSALGVDGTILTGLRYDAAFDMPPDLQTTRNPAITSNPLAIKTKLGDNYPYTVAATNPEGGSLSFVLATGPVGMNVNSLNGAVTWTAGFVPSRVKIVVTDGKGGKVVHGYWLPVITPLSDAQPVTISAPALSTGYATIVVPANVSVMQVRVRGSSGEPDLVVIGPTLAFGISARLGANETLSFPNPAAGEWQIQVLGSSSYAGVSLSANFITPAPIYSTTSLSNLSGIESSETFYRIAVPNGATSLSITTTGGTGDLDIVLKKGSPAVCQATFFVLAACLFDQKSDEDGNGETIVVTNPAAADWYLDLVGYQAFSGVKLDIALTVPPLALTSTGAVTTSTLGNSGNVSVGYATASVETGTPPFATAVFSLTQNGVVVSEAGVPSSPPVQSARIFIEYRTGVAAGIGTLDIFTGLALANRGTSPANLTFTLRDKNGQVLTTGHATLAANAHSAKFVHQLKEIAPDFNLPSNFSSATLYGSLEISSSQPISVLGLRLTTNQRGDTLLTSTAVADLSKAAGNAPLYFAQLADGGGYTTSVILTNTTGSTETGSIAILDDAGSPLTVQPVGGTPASTFSYSIPAAGTFVLQTDGSPQDGRAGWVKVTPNNGSTSPVGAGVFSFSPGGILVTESGVPAASPTTRARLYIDKSKGHDTGLAIGNPGGQAITVTMQASQATSGAGAGAATFNVLANGHKSAFAGELIASLPDGFTGIADLTSTSPFVPLTLRSLTNSRKDFLLTTFPAPDIGQPAPTPIVFPQIVDGGGYATQFIFISATGAATVNLNFVGDDGLPLSVGRQ